MFSKEIMNEIFFEGNRYIEVKKYILNDEYKEIEFMKSIYKSTALGLVELVGIELKEINKECVRIKEIIDTEIKEKYKKEIETLLISKKENNNIYENIEGINYAILKENNTKHTFLKGVSKRGDFIKTYELEISKIAIILISKAINDNKYIKCIKISDNLYCKIQTYENQFIIHIFNNHHIVCHLIFYKKDGKLIVRMKKNS